LFVTEENSRNLDDAFCVLQQKNDAVPAYSFPVPPLPASAFEGNDIPAKGIGFEIVDGTCNAPLDLVRKTFELSLCLVGEFSVSVHL
jgi:hypothetical protein